MALITFVATLSACTTEADMLLLGIPPVPGAKSELLAIHKDNSTDVLAFNLDDGPLPIDKPIGDDDVVEAYVYTESLEDLRIRPATCDAPAERLRDPPAGGLAFTASLNTPDWSPQPGPSPRMRIGDPPAFCPSRTDTSIDAPSSGFWSTRVGPTSFLYGSGSLRRVELEPELQILTVTETPDVDARSIITIDETNFIVIERNGRVHRAELTEPLRMEYTVLSTATFPTPVSNVKGGMVGGDLELFAVRSAGSDAGGTEGVAYWFHQRQWEEIHRVEGPFTKKFDSDTVWDGPGRGAFVWGGDPNVYSFDNSRTPRVRVEEVPNNLQGLLRLERLESGTLVALAQDAKAHVQENGEWITIDPETIFDVSEITPFRDGFLWGGSLGSLFYYADARTVCELTVRFFVVELMPIDDQSFVAVGDLQPGHGLTRVDLDFPSSN